MPAPPERPTVRVLLMDEQDRVLLMKGRAPGAAPGAGVWFTVGGGLNPGESVLEGAAREVLEETGIAEVTFGPAVWTRQGVLHAPEPLLFRETYVAARCRGAEPDRSGWEALERELIEDIRWWTLAELITTADRVYPPGLARLLPDILAGRFPAEPLELPWE